MSIFWIHENFKIQTHGLYISMIVLNLNQITDFKFSIKYCDLTWYEQEGEEVSFSNI